MQYHKTLSLSLSLALSLSLRVWLAVSPSLRHTHMMLVYLIKYKVLRVFDEVHQQPDNSTSDNALRACVCLSSATLGM